MGTNFDGRNSWASWKAAFLEEDLRAFVEDFVTRREGDVAQEDRWRSKMMKRVDEHFYKSGRALHERLDRLERLLAKD